DGIGGNDPQGANLFCQSSLNDVGVSQAAGGRYATGVDVPKPRNGFPVLRTFKLPVAGKARSESRLARAHRVALPGDRKGRSTRLPDVSGNKRQIVDRIDRLGALGAVIHSHGPTDEWRLRVTVEQRGFDQLLRGKAGYLRHRFGMVVANGLFELGKPGRVPRD